MARALIFVVVIILCPVVTGASCGSEALPREVQRLVNAKWEKWKIVTVDALREPDQKIWQQHFGSDCPGIAFGRFSSRTEKKATAISLWRVEGKSLQQLLLVFVPKGDGFTQVVLEGPAVVAYLSVVRILRPGAYMEVGSQRRVRVSSQLIGYEAIEAGMIAFGLGSNGRWVRFQVSE